MSRERSAMRIAHKGRIHRSGFTLVELMIVVAIIAVVSALAVPKLNSARIPAQESAAIAALRSITSAQAQVQASNAIDSDADGAGEYGSFGELTGVRPMRVSAAGAPAPGAAGIDELEPAVLSRVFGNIDGNGVLVHKGYVYKIYLPTAGPAPVGIPEEADGGFRAGPFPDPANSQFLWCVYAWPFDVGVSGVRAFFANQEGEILASPNRGAGGLPVYESSTPANHPPFSAAYLNADMAGGIAIGAIGSDGNLWAPVR